MTDNLEIKVSASGKIFARRRDRRPLNDEDRHAARELADDMRGKFKQLGVTLEVLVQIFGDVLVIEGPTDKSKPLRCPHCDKETVPQWRRGGKIIQRVEPNGSRVWACHFCGRQVNA